MPMVTRKPKMTDDKKAITRGHPDLTQFIRSIQRIEGKPDCFARIVIVAQAFLCPF